MFASFLLSFREGLEAALVVGIILGALNRMERRNLKPVVWRAVAAAVILSLAAGGILQAIGSKLEGQAEMIFEGTTMLLAGGLLTWMIFWMRRQSVNHNKSIETSLRIAASQTGRTAVFLLVFTAIAREGFELAVFLLAAGMSATPVENLSGALLGLAAAVALGWLLFTTTRSLSLKRFFQVTNILLVLFAAGLVVHGIHEFNDIGWVPAIVDHIWDVNPVLDENQPAGQFLKALFGYNGDPSLTEVIAYIGFLWVMLFGLYKKVKPEIKPILP
jgi:high-affinity iron transporter